VASPQNVEVGNAVKSRFLAIKSETINSLDEIGKERGYILKCQGWALISEVGCVQEHPKIPKSVKLATYAELYNKLIGVKPGKEERHRRLSHDSS